MAWCKNGHNELFVCLWFDFVSPTVSSSLQQIDGRSGQHLTVAFSSCVAVLRALRSLSWSNSRCAYEFDHPVHGCRKRKSLQIRDPTDGIRIPCSFVLRRGSGFRERYENILIIKAL